MRALLGLAGLAGAVAETTVPPPLPDPARDAAIRAVLPLVPLTGWTRLSLRAAAGEGAELLFPGGAPEMVEAHSDLADRMMAAEVEALAEQRVSRRVRALLLARFRHWDADRDAIRRGLALLALPPHRPVAVRTLARTVDAVWQAAGDDAQGFSRYSKRAILAGVYVPTLLFWLRHGSGPETESFLDRRLMDVARLGRLRSRFVR